MAYFDLFILSACLLAKAHYYGLKYPEAQTAFYDCCEELYADNNSQFLSLMDWLFKVEIKPDLLENLTLREEFLKGWHLYNGEYYPWRKDGDFIILDMGGWELPIRE